VRDVELRQLHSVTSRSESPLSSAWTTGPGRVLPGTAPLHSCLHRLQRSAHRSLAAPMTKNTDSRGSPCSPKAARRRTGSCA